MGGRGWLDCGLCSRARPTLKCGAPLSLSSLYAFSWDPPPPPPRPRTHSLPPASRSVRLPAVSPSRGAEPMLPAQP
uniref:Uncharacterized protein n=1 Tax=Knipowitschia caucasica TaxID=637954 RepID=A0AAV2LY71_KNICA